MSQEFIYEAKYRISDANHSGLKDVLKKIMVEQEGFRRINQSNPFSSEYSQSLEFVRIHRERQLPLKMKLKRFAGFLDEKQVGQYQYNRDLKLTRPETVHVVKFSIIPNDDGSLILRVRTEPVAVHKEAQLGINTEDLDKNSRSRIHDTQQDFIRRNFGPLAGEIISKPAPKSSRNIELPSNFENFPEECKNSFREAQECFKHGLTTASSVMVARALEAGIAEKYVEAGNTLYPQNGSPKNLAGLLNWIEQSRDFDIPKKLVDFFDNIKWQRRISAHYSEGILPDEESLPQFFRRSFEILNIIYSEDENHPT